MISSNFKEELIKYSELYFELGILEKLLRVTIPRSLGSNPYDPLDLDWMQRLPVDELNQKRFQKAMGLVEAE